ncbi:sulfur carrier protein ThiS [Shewanella woodyi]|uniref:Thiamine biosynthesis protein ThiS n=1 Tax=Shewanella woodyi (strain ATCC 51908 / MS32) TaxID=392500 RepID=B1KHI1_SHEWM|nr:sulfur carrier protein ThiS [Shewanella woodyi]ACA86866.1 thiamine biosynthesis protein ThiS [Shewanella woodyi ATCC 51908]
MESVNIYINDEPLTISSSQSFKALVDGQGVKIKSVALVCNSVLVPRAAWQERCCKEGDKIEIFSVVAGG